MAYFSGKGGTGGMSLDKPIGPLFGVPQLQLRSPIAASTSAWSSSRWLSAIEVLAVYGRLALEVLHWRWWPKPLSAAGALSEKVDW